MLTSRHFIRCSTRTKDIARARKLKSLLVWHVGQRRKHCRSTRFHHFFDVSSQLVINEIDRLVGVHDAKAVTGLHLLELVRHQSLVLQEAVEHVSAQSEVHPTL